jgi:MFS family permease
MSTQPASGAFSFLMKENIVAKPGYNRWLVPPASIAIHMCIGSVYAWSVFNPALTRELGIVASAADDWTLSSVVWIFSVAIVFLGLAAAFGGKWLEKVGPRCVGVTAAILWGGGFIIGSLGISSHQLWLVYLGYGVLGGAGLGFGYVSPVSTLIRWFPDRRGMATGMAIMGFGGGAMIAAPLKQWLLSIYAKAPDFLGGEGTLTLITEGGRRFVETAAGKVEVIVATAAQAASIPGGGEAGVYAVGTGNTGAAATFMTLGIVYFCIMVFASFQYRVPAEGWTPEGWSPPVAKGGMVTRNNVHIDEALKTRQFWLLWIVLCFNVTAGIGVIGVAKTMINDIFGDIVFVTAAFAGTYVLMISVFNMVGRFFWASTSDFIGRKNTYHCFFILGTILYLSIPYFASAGGPAALIGFYVATMIIFTMYGGGFATIPAYLADMFGTLHVGGIHGRLLTAWSTAGVLGPFAITYLRNISKDNAIADLVSKIDPTAFMEKFGAPVTDLAQLVSAKSVTIVQLMEIAPVGTIDPTSSLYNTTMYCMAALLVIAFFANLMVRPVKSRHHVETTHPKMAPAE